MTTRVAVTVTAIAGLGGFLAATSADAHERGMVFRDNRPRTLTLEEAEKGVTVSICNTESREATALDARFDGFAFKSRTGNELDTTAVFEELAAPESLAEGSCAELTIKKKPEVRLADGSYPGLVTVSSGGAGLGRLELTLTVEPNRKAITPAGFLDDAPLQANRDGPELDTPLGLLRATGGTELEDGGYLPLKAPKRVSEKLSLPGQGSALGSIFNGSDRARVFVGSGRVVEYDDVWLVPLRVESANKTGDYKGMLELDQSATPETGIPITLTVKDDWEWAVLAILLGAMLPVLLVQLPLSRWRLQWTLWRRRANLSDEYQKAADAFKKHEPSFDAFKRPSEARVNEYAGQVDKNTERYARSVIFFDLTSEAYKAIDKSLRQAEEDARCFGAEHGLHESLTQLVEALENLASYLTEKLRVRSHPKLIRTAGALLTGKELVVGEATARKSEVDDFTKFIGEWTVAAERARGLEVWLRRLSQTPPSNGTPDHARLSRAAIHIAEAKHELMAATDRKSLDAAGTTRNLDAAYDGLAYLGAKYQVPQPDPDEQLTDYLVEWRMLGITGPTRLMLDLDGAVDQSVELWQSAWARAQTVGDTFLDVASATTGAVLKGLRWLWDLAILASAVLVGVGAGLTTLYFDKSFGSSEDYITALAVGAASTVLSKGVLDALTQMRAQDAEPIEAESPKPAKVVPQVA